MKKRLTESVSFFKAWLASPLKVASVVPSSEALAQAITTDVEPDAGPVLELGPGTGVFTRAILARGVRPENLTLVETSPEFSAKLRNEFPGVRILTLDATQLVEARIYDGQPLHAVISGLPLLSMKRDKVAAVLRGVFHYLQPGGSLYQFTYGPVSPISDGTLESLGLTATRVSYTIRNIPPASVYRITRIKG